MQMISQNQLIFDKSVYDICPYKEMLFFHKQTKKKLMFILKLAAKFAAKKKHNIVSSN